MDLSSSCIFAHDHSILLAIWPLAVIFIVLLILQATISMHLIFFEFSIINSSIYKFLDSITFLIVIVELSNVAALFIFQRSIAPFYPLDEKSFVAAIFTIFTYFIASSMQFSIVVLTDVIFLCSVNHFPHTMGLIICIKVSLISHVLIIAPIVLLQF